MKLNDATIALAALGQATRLSVFRLLVEAGLATDRAAPERG